MVATMTDCRCTTEWFRPSLRRNLCAASISVRALQKTNRWRNADRARDGPARMKTRLSALPSFFRINFTSSRFVISLLAMEKRGGKTAWSNPPRRRHRIEARRSHLPSPSRWRENYWGLNQARLGWYVRRSARQRHAKQYDRWQAE